MKKLISLLAVLTASLMITAVASATPSVEITATPLTAETVGDYGAEAVDGLDAYALQVSLSDVALNRTNAVKVTGTVLTGFELIYDMSEEDYNKIDKDYSLVYDSVYALSADVFGQSKLTGDYTYTTQLGAPTNTASYPAKNTTVAAEDSNVLYTAVIYIPTGESITLNVNALSGGFGTFASGNVDSSTQWGFDAIATPDSVNVNANSITLGEVEPPAPSTPDAVKFYAVLPACKKAEASAVAQFQFDSNADGVADKGYNYDLGSLTWDTDVTVGVQVEEIDDGVTLALTNVLWK